MRSLTFRMTLLLCAAGAGSVAATGADETQTDWCGGGNIPGPVTAFDARFDSQTGMSWLAIPGHLALAAAALPAGREHLINDAYYLAFGIHPADIDGDGDVDIVGTAESSGLVTLWLNDGMTPPVLTEQLIDTDFPGADGLWVEDLDGDGRRDVIATAAQPAHRIAWWRNEGGHPILWTRQVIEPVWIDAFEVTAADVDGDGRQDVLSASWTSNRVAWWRNGGGNPIAWTRQDVDAAFAGAHSACGADLDADGDTDIVGAGGVVDEIAWWRNDGGHPISWVKQTLRTGFDGARSVQAADIDGDGDLDVAGICWNRHLAWWRNDGGQPLRWTEQTVDAILNGGHSVWVADMNGDGRRDLLGLACNSGFITWYENGGGSPVTWTRRVVDSGYSSPITVRAGDIDNDGALDVLGTSYNWGAFNWWEVTDFAAAGELTSSILDSQTEPGLGSIDWHAVTPAGTSLAFQVRCAPDPADMGPWSPDITAPGTLPVSPARYIQYRVLGATESPDCSPILRDVTFRRVDAGGAPADPRAHLSLRIPGPAPVGAVMEFRLPCRGPIELTLFDPAGRQLRALARGTHEAGVHRVCLPPLVPGVYFARLRAAGASVSRAVVLVAP